MNGKTDIHPDAVLEALLAKGGRSNRRANLVKMQELCRKQHEKGSRDYTLPAIGRLVEAEGIIKGRALYNAQSADYRALIEAWAAFSGPAAPKPPKILASHEFLVRIEDPAIRSIMQAIIAERDRLRAQLNTLKSSTLIVVDRRPKGVSNLPGVNEKPHDAPWTKEAITLSEREALEKAVSAEYLEERGLHEGSHGEIVNDRGRTVFDVGFARAIRKILGIEKQK